MEGSRNRLHPHHLPSTDVTITFTPFDKSNYIPQLKKTLETLTATNASPNDVSVLVAGMISEAIRSFNSGTALVNLTSFLFRSETPNVPVEQVLQNNRLNSMTGSNNFTNSLDQSLDQELNLTNSLDHHSDQKFHPATNNTGKSETPKNQNLETKETETDAVPTSFLSSMATSAINMMSPTKQRPPPTRDERGRFSLNPQREQPYNSPISKREAAAVAANQAEHLRSQTLNRGARAIGKLASAQPDSQVHGIETNYLAWLHLPLT